jgi:hypothetical protein
MELAEEFLDRYRKGERPPLKDRKSPVRFWKVKSVALMTVV